MERAVGVHLLELGHAGRRRVLGELPREQEVAGEPARDLDDLAAQADLVDVLPEDDLHQFVTYGSSAISRARLTATATCFWWRRQVPVIRRERILPFSETYRRSWL